jgi:hypothetical protein
MEHDTSTNPEQDLERTGDELEERIGRIDEQIDDARGEAKARHEDTDTYGDDDAEDDDGDPASFDDPDAVDEDDEDDE